MQMKGRGQEGGGAGAQSPGQTGPGNRQRGFRAQMHARPGAVPGSSLDFGHRSEWQPFRERLGRSLHLHSGSRAGTALPLPQPCATPIPVLQAQGGIPKDGDPCVHASMRQCMYACMHSQARAPGNDGRFVKRFPSLPRPAAAAAPLAAKFAPSAPRIATHWEGRPPQELPGLPPRSSSWLGCRALLPLLLLPPKVGIYLLNCQARFFFLPPLPPPFAAPVKLSPAATEPGQTAPPPPAESAASL